jgi:hypothetical protein
VTEVDTGAWLSCYRDLSAELKRKKDEARAERQVLLETLGAINPEDLDEHLERIALLTIKLTTITTLLKDYGG